MPEFPRPMDIVVVRTMECVKREAFAREWPEGSEMAKARMLFDESNPKRYGMSVNPVKCFEEMGMPDVAAQLRDPSRGYEEIERIAKELGQSARKRVEHGLMELTNYA